MQQYDYGIHSIGTAIPKYCLKTEELASLRNTSSNKYKIGLGCEEMALCSKDETAITLGITAARRTIEHWGGNIKDIGLLAIGTESGIDMSRPLSAWIAEALGIAGAVRSYEIKHACYGGTLALRQAIEWKYSANCRQKVALVIATDQALYAPGHPGEPTQGAGAIAFIIDQPIIAAIGQQSYYWSEPHFDFFRPIGEDFPTVNGKLSLSCYNKAVINCFNQISSPLHINTYDYLTFHVPFPKIVYKAVKYLAKYCEIDETVIDNFFNTKVQPTLAWNKKIGNAYTASLWFAVAKALTLALPQQLITAFSYGSGFGAELLLLKCVSNQHNAPWVMELEHDLQNRIYLTAKQYQELRS